MAIILDDDAMEFGQIYRSAAVLGAGDELPWAARPDEWAGTEKPSSKHSRSGRAALR
ncbi:MAG: hypothetical protein WDO69_04995 [Pseudomonadota bacterium]